MIKIKSITGNTNLYNNSWDINVTVEMDSKEFLKYKNKKCLGELYGIIIGNKVYAINDNIPAHNPTVSDKRRSRKGIKTIWLTYRLISPNSAKSLGFGLTIDNMPKFTDYITIYTWRPELKLVV